MLLDFEFEFADTVLIKRFFSLCWISAGFSVERADDIDAFFCSLRIIMSQIRSGSQWHVYDNHDSAPQGNFSKCMD